MSFMHGSPGASLQKMVEFKLSMLLSFFISILLSLISTGYLKGNDCSARYDLKLAIKIKGIPKIVSEKNS